jgi:isoleucyl-tRNA synthetase
VSDRIRLTIDAPDHVSAAARAHERLIRSETLAVDVAYGRTTDGIASRVGDGTEVNIGIGIENATAR